MTPTDSLRQEAQALAPELVRIRRALHPSTVAKADSPAAPPPLPIPWPIVGKT